MEQKNFDIHMIEALTEAEAAAMALETLTIKDHTVYLVDFGGYFGYSALVYKNAHHIYHANDYELHHAGKTREELRDWYLRTLENKLFTEAEIAEPIKTYDEYRRKSYFLTSYYGMQRDYISMFCITHNDAEEEAYKKSVEGKIPNMVTFAYYNPEDAEFVKHHIALYKQLQEAKQNIADDYAYWKSAFYYEMGNHEYHINSQGDWDVLSVFGNVNWLGMHADLDAYFDELSFSEQQRRAYRDARKQFLRDAMENDWY